MHLARGFVGEEDFVGQVLIYMNRDNPHFSLWINVVLALKRLS